MDELVQLAFNVANRYGRGACLTDEAALAIRTTFPSSPRADWYLSLLSRIPLAGCEIRIDSERDLSGIGVEMSWFSGEQIYSEAFECLPGIALAKHGYLPMGACCLGSGDPYFIQLSEPNSAAVVRAPHTAVDGTAGNWRYSLDALETVAVSLMEFFEVCRSV